MKSKIILCLALVLSGGLFGCSNIARADESATNTNSPVSPPAAKDAYVNAQLAELFAGAPVQVVFRRAFDNSLLMNVTMTNRLVPPFSVSLFNFDNEAAARQMVQDELYSFTPTSLTKEGYDEFYSGNGGRLIGRRGTSVVVMYSSPPEVADALIVAIAKNLSVNPALLPDLIHYAYTMHFGDTAPLRALLSKLNVKVPELSAANNLSDSGHPYGQSCVTANYTDSDGNNFDIIAKAYDSEVAAREGQEFDSAGISVNADKTEIIQGVKVHEYTRYGGLYFQTGCYTFRFETFRQDGKDLLPLMLKVSSALIGEVKQANLQKENSP